MPNTEKVECVAALKERIEGSAALLLAEYRGLTVSEISELRRSLREADTSFAVIKNTLMQRAAADAGIDDLAPMLTGPSAVAFVGGDPVAAAKKLKAAMKQYPSLVLKGAYLDGAVLDEAGASGLADLESREVMLSKVAGMLKSEMSRAAAMFVGASSKFLSLLEAYKEKVPAGEASEPSGEDQAPATEDAAAAEFTDEIAGEAPAAAEAAGDEPSTEPSDEPSEPNTEPSTEEA
jgi:large subunit ribosomal protein L10